MFRSYNTIQAHPINQGEPELFYGLSNITGCPAQEHPAWFASNSSYRSSFYFLIGNLYDDDSISHLVCYHIGSSPTQEKSDELTRDSGTKLLRHRTRGEYQSCS